MNLNRLNKIVQYLKLTVLAIPYASIKLVVNKQVIYEYKGNDKIKVPERAKPTQLHPHGVDTHEVQALIEKSKNNGNGLTISQFIKNNFYGVGSKTAEDFLKFAKIRSNKQITKLEHNELMKLVDTLNEFENFRPPDIKCLSILTKENVTTGLETLFKPEKVFYTKRKGVYHGHGFIIELAIAFGGQVKSPKQEYKFKVFRYANKMPLLYDFSSCALYKNVMSINFKRYNIDGNMPIYILIHMASTKIPYKTEGKEYISADYQDINKQIKLGMKDLLKQLGAYISQTRKFEYEKHRTNKMLLYIPVLGNCLGNITQTPPNEIETLIKKTLNLKEEQQ